MRPITHIMLHHSLTKDSHTVSWAAIEQYHKETNKWKDIGYHFGLERVVNMDLQRWLAPYSYQALIGRPVEQEGSACPQGNMNQVAIHICVVGNFDIEYPTEELYERLYKRLVGPLSHQYKIPPENWVGHRDYNPHKSCPGTFFDLDRLRKFHKGD